MPGRPVTRAEIDRMVELRRAGRTLREIEADTGRSKSVICRQLAAAGVDDKPAYYWTDAEIEVLYQDFPAGVPIDVIHARLPRWPIPKIYAKAELCRLRRPAGPVRRAARGGHSQPAHAAPAT